jgi:hypothetical protein
MAKGTPLCISGVKDEFGHNTTVDVFWANIQKLIEIQRNILNKHFTHQSQKVAVQFEN